MESPASGARIATVPAPRSRRVPQWCMAASATLCVLLAACYALRPDACAAVTIYPAWVWPLPGLLLALPGLRRSGRHITAVIVLLWLAFLFGFAGEVRSLLHLHPARQSAMASLRARGRAVRVVTLNCGGDNPLAAAEVAAYHPDIVLLQERPGVDAVARLARALYGTGGSYLTGPDTAIVAHGTLTPAAVPRALDSNFIRARVHLSSGIETEVISLRLLPPLFRLDLWSPDCWRVQTANRRHRRRQLRRVAAQVQALPNAVPVIAGGDFNAPAGDAVFRLLRPHLHDAFAQGGAGWGNTVINDLPFHRIDQVWVSRHYSGTSVNAYRTAHSDHRLVVCDLLFAPTPAREGSASTGDGLPAAY